MIPTSVHYQQLATHVYAPPTTTTTASMSNVLLVCITVRPALMVVAAKPVVQQRAGTWLAMDNAHVWLVTTMSWVLRPV